MRERIKGELSDFFTDEVLLPSIQAGYDTSFFEMIQLNRAYAIMQEKVGMLDKTSCATILDGLAHVRDNLKRDQLTGKREDFYYNVETAMIEKIGIKVGGRLHTGRSRNDLLLTLYRMDIRKSVWPVVEMLISLQEALLEKADANLETVITGYTHFQPGQPTTFAHYCTALLGALGRDFERIRSAYAVINQSPYGAAAFAGTNFPVDRNMLRELLGFDALVKNTLDSVASRDYLLQLEMAYTIMMVNIGRFAEDFDIWATNEFGWLELGGEIAGSSSIMPQKKNPVTIEHARAKVAQCVGSMMAAVTSLKSSPFSINMDQFEAAGYYAEGRKQVVMGLGLLREIVRYSDINRDLALERTRKNMCTVTSLADHLVKNYGISFKEAHGIVGKIVAIVTENNQGIDGITPVLIKTVSKEISQTDIVTTTEELKGVLDPLDNIQSKVTTGGPRVDSVKEMIAEVREQVSSEKAWLAEVKGRVEKAYDYLDREEARIKGA